MTKETTQQATPNTSEKRSSIKSLFKTVLRKTDAQAPDNTNQKLVQSSVTSENWENRRDGETYHNYGKRICGRATASKYTFSAFLQRIFNIERQEQKNNSALQQQYRNDVKSRISEIDGKINQVNGRIERLLVSRQKIQDNISLYNDELSELKAKNGEVNKNAKVKLYLGVVILLLLTLYLFVFYSSTFYSAFFKDFMAAGSTNIGAHMFDSQAIAASWSVGIGQLLFVLSAPIIFLGLGFALHYFSKEKGYFIKYFKISVIIIITFIFDCILAYSIAKNIHLIQSMSSLNEMTEYSISEAMTDSNVWAVIFCGFIVYIIWGVVFNLTMTAYEELRSNKNEQQNLLGKIEDLKNSIANNELEESDAKLEKGDLERQKNVLTQSLNNKKLIDFSPIKVALNDFYAGWMEMMAALSCSSNLQAETANLYNSNIDTFFNQPEETKTK